MIAYRSAGRARGAAAPVWLRSASALVACFPSVGGFRVGVVRTATRARPEHSSRGQRDLQTRTGGPGPDRGALPPPASAKPGRRRAGPGHRSALLGRLATRKSGPGARASRQQPGLMQPVSAAQARRAARPSESLQQRAVVFHARTAPDGARARPGIGRDAGAARGQNMCIWARAELAEPLRVPR